MDDDSTTRQKHSFAGKSDDSQSDTFRPKQGNPRSAYIHVPFCRHRCGYCNFTLVAGRDYLIERFLNALEIEIGWLDQAYEIETLFLGGGTPSHLSPAQLYRLDTIIRTRLNLTATAEVTAECNPNDLNRDRMAALSELGVNRISLGAQSLNSEKLKRLERDHSPSDVRDAIEIAKEYSAKVSLDLIFAAPDEPMCQWEVDLAAAIALGPDHMSTYELTYEKGTQFWNQLHHDELTQADEDLRADMYSFATDSLSQSGLPQYEVSSFAATTNQCRHNLAYWVGDPFFAFGPGAARFVDGIRETNHRSTMQYLKTVESGNSPVAEREQLDPDSAARERLAIGLRMIAGIDGVDFERQTHRSVSSVLGDLENQLIANELLVCQGNQWRLTKRGIMLCDWVAGEILRS